MDPVTIGLILGGNALQAFGGYLSGKSQEEAMKEEQERQRAFEKEMFQERLKAARVTRAPGATGMQFAARGRIGAAAPAAAPAMSPDQALQMREQGQL